MRAVTAMRCIAEFSCIGAACEDSCCSGWQVPVDQGRYARLRRACQSPEERLRFAQVALLPPEERDRERFALILLNQDGACPFWDEERLCAIQRRHGPALLPATCHSFPRQVAHMGSHAEVAGSLSCPEVARRLLLADGGADWVEAPRDLADQGLQTLDLAPAQRQPFARFLQGVRGGMIELLLLRDYPIESRLYFMAAQARSAPRDPAAWHGELQGRERGPAGLAAVHAILGLRPVHPALERLIDEVLRDPGGAAWPRRRQAVEALHGERVAGYLVRYCQAFWCKDWHLFSGDLVSHAQGLLLRVAVQRFLLLCHPLSPGATGAELDALAVRVFYSFARTLEHNPLFQQALGRIVAADLQGLEQSADLALL